MTQRSTREAIIAHYNLQRLPIEGVLFTQLYRSAELVDAVHRPERYRGEKPYGTVALALFTADGDSFSSMHRLQTDEVWHFYLGDALEILLLYPDGRSEHVTLGQNIFDGQKLVHVVPHGVWMGARVRAGGEWSLIGNTMAPGFTSSDFEAGGRDELLTQYPHERDMILALTHEGEHTREMPEGY
jgi:hypothetical protein